MEARKEWGTRGQAGQHLPRWKAPALATLPATFVAPQVAPHSGDAAPPQNKYGLLKNRPSLLVICLPRPPEIGALPLHASGQGTGVPYPFPSLPGAECAQRGEPRAPGGRKAEAGAVEVGFRSLGAAAWAALPPPRLGFDAAAGGEEDAEELLPAVSIRRRGRPRAGAAGGTWGPGSRSQEARARGGAELQGGGCTANFPGGREAPSHLTVAPPPAARCSGGSRPAPGSSHPPRPLPGTRIPPSLPGPLR